jgi:toxin secretion/phage lysis holin
MKNLAAKTLDTVVEHPAASKSALSVIVGVVSGRYGLLPALMSVLMVCMMVDFVTGMMASAILKMKNPKSKKHGLSSRRGMIGIFKKLSYLLAVGVGIMFDWLLHLTIEHFDMPFGNITFFGALVAVWYIINELMSIIENLDEMDARVPKWMKKVMIVLKKRVDDKGEAAATVGELTEKSDGE